MAECKDADERNGEGKMTLAEKIKMLMPGYQVQTDELGCIIIKDSKHGVKLHPYSGLTDDSIVNVACFLTNVFEGANVLPR